MNDRSDSPLVPEGFKPLPVGGDFIGINGPLYVRSVALADGSKQRHIGFRVEQRHCNPMGNCHGGMLATFADMMLPMLAHRQGSMPFRVDSNDLI